ncbi:MAG TPA: carboxypeptidase-like regulatory domain-containing protein [Pyrinomonadaceae bacterium]
MSSKRTEFTLEEITRELEQKVGGADKLRADGLEQLGAVRRAREAGLRREQARLTKKHGAEHPSVVAITNRLTANTGMVRDLGLEASRARVQPPRVDARGWAVHGFVRDKELKPVGGLTVALYDAQSRWVEQAGFACTKADGYFLIRLNDAGALPGPLFLRVLSGQAVHLFADPSPLTPTTGAVVSREIFLSEDGRACVPPVTGTSNPVAAAGAWVVRGRITDAKGAGRGGLTVSIFDKDSVFTDRLGQTKTDENGDYSFTFDTENFRDLIERKPDLFLKVLDPNGRTLFAAEQAAIRFQAGRVEVIDLTLS